MSLLQIIKMELGPIGTNAYLLWEDGCYDAVLIDAPPDCHDTVQPILDKESLVLREIWLTHGHWDHIAGASKMVNDQIILIGHREDQALFENPSLMSTFAMPGINLEPISITKWVADGDILNLFGRKVTVYHCPGHCPGNIIFWIEEEQKCFVGDVIFDGSIGRADLPGGDFNTLVNSIQTKIYNLPVETEICPGHGSNTTVARERAGNPFVHPA